MEEEILVGGQAVIEGVMMKSPSRIAIAIRKESGEIVIKKENYKPWTKVNRILSVPVIRGAVSLFEMMAIGIKALNYSANEAMKDIEKEKDDKEKTKKTSNMATFVSMAVALVVALLVFLYLPLKIASLFDLDNASFQFNLIAGAFRFLFFIVYLLLISFLKDIKRIFEYHGAEHKAVFAFEAGDELVTENAAKYTTLHPRCGTSFLMVVIIIALVFYSIVDAIVILIAQTAPAVWQRFLYHLPLLPVVAGISYECIRFANKNRKGFFFKLLIFPGLMLQKITTKEPSGEQLAVAIEALKSSLEKDSINPVKPES